MNPGTCATAGLPDIRLQKISMKPRTCEAPSLAPLCVCVFLPMIMDLLYEVCSFFISFFLCFSLDFFFFFKATTLVFRVTFTPFQKSTKSHAQCEFRGSPEVRGFTALFGSLLSLDLSQRVKCVIFLAETSGGRRAPRHY